MHLDLDLTQEQSPQQTLKVSPRLVAANYILELSSQELQEVISDELRDNPALEQLEVPVCQVCGSELQGSICPRCLQRQKVEDESVASRQTFDDDGLGRNQPDRDEDFDPLTRVASEETLAERLMADLGALVDDGDMPIAEFLVGSLDDKGYLVTSLDEAAYQLGVDEQRVKHVLDQLQSLEPVGIGARNLRECLLIQLDHLEARGVQQPYAREVIGQFLRELGEHKFGRIAQALRIPQRQVEEVWDFVKRKLNPHPAYGFSSTNSRDRDTRAMYVLPDVVVREGEEGLEVEVVESRRFALRLSSVYTRLSQEPQDNGNALSPNDKKHIQEYVGRARLFIANINQRRQTLYNITQCLVRLQQEFLTKGIRHLKPLSRAAVALELGVHESTVSRATASKHVMLPSGEVIPFSHFFTPSLSIKDVIKELIEDEGRPLTDVQIAERLRKRGINIARRTVAKYRKQLDILPSSLR